LAGIEPLAVNNWFLAHYIDAYEWVMLPNVLGMGLHADGGQTATKPYMASANYINKMGDYCGGCRFNHKQRHGEDACPFNFLYWNFLLQHEDTLRANPRLGPNVLGLRYLDDDERTAVRQQAQNFMDNLA
jgi:deoxyribodipyrimidine photolyase-related protein